MSTSVPTTTPPSENIRGPALDDNINHNSSNNSNDDDDGEMQILSSVCSAAWDDIAEDYVDRAGRACMNAIVATTKSAAPTLSLHEVTVDTVGVIGIQVHRHKCRDYTELAVSPGPPNQVCLVVSFLRDGQVFATTPLSQPLKTATLGDDPSIVSDISSLEASFMDLAQSCHSGAPNHGEAAVRQAMAVWGKNHPPPHHAGDVSSTAATASSHAKRQVITFDSCLEVSAQGERASDIDVVLYLVDTSHYYTSMADDATADSTIASSVHNNCNNAAGLASVPLAIGKLRIQGNGDEKRMVCDMPLHEPPPPHQEDDNNNNSHTLLPTLWIPAAATGKDPQDTTVRATAGARFPPAVMVMPRPPSRKKKQRRGLSKLFKGRNAKKGPLSSQDEEKKQDFDDDESLSMSLCNTLPSFLNDAYTLDPIHGAFLRFQVEWKEKETNFEVNLTDSFQAESLTKINSLRDQEGSVQALQRDVSTGTEREGIPQEEEDDAQSQHSRCSTKNGKTEAKAVKKGNDEGDIVVSSQTGKQPPAKKKEERKPPRGPSKTPAASSATPAKPAKKNKGKSFFFKKRKNEDKKEVMNIPEPPIVNNSQSRRDRGITMMPREQEERQVPPEPDQKAKKAAMLLELREGSRPIPDMDEAGAKETDPPSRGQPNVGDNDDETAHSLFDSVYKAVVGDAETSSATSDVLEVEIETTKADDQGAPSIFNSVIKAVVGKSKTEVVVKDGEAESPSVATTAQTSQSTPRTGTQTRNSVPAGIATEANSKVEQDNAVDDENEGEMQHPVQIQPHIDDTDSRAGVEMTPDNGIYAQFVQATNSLFGGVDGYPHVEFKQLYPCGELNHEPSPALEMSVSNESSPADESVLATVPELAKEISPEQSTRTGSGPIDVDEVVLSDDDKVEDDSLSPNTQVRSTTPSPEKLSLERILSWDERQIEGRKGPKFGFGRRNRGAASVKSAPSKSIRNKKNSKVLSLASQIESRMSAQSGVSDVIAKKSSVENGKNQSEGKPPQKPLDPVPVERKSSLKPPSSARYVLQDRTWTKGVEQEPSTPSKADATPKRRKLWGKLFKSKSSSTLILDPPVLDSKVTGTKSVVSVASVVSDAETVEIENMAKTSVIEALGGRAIPPSPVPMKSRSNSCGKSDRSAFVSEPDEAREAQVATSSFSFFDMGCGPLNVDGKEAWLYARDDDTFVTKETQGTYRDELTLIPSPSDVLLSETYHRCGPARIADLGDAVLDEANCRPFFRDKADTETLASFTFDEPTFDPSVLSADNKSASIASRTRSNRSNQSRSLQKTPSSPPGIAPSPSTEKLSPRGVADFDRTHEEPSKVESFSEAFVNFITCRMAGRDPLNGTVPSEFIRRNDTDSVGDDLTLTTYEMQVEIEQYKKKIEQARHEAECLDENGEEVGDDAALVFQSPNVGGQPNAAR